MYASMADSATAEIIYLFKMKFVHKVHKIYKRMKIKTISGREDRRRNHRTKI